MLGTGGQQPELERSAQDFRPVNADPGLVEILAVITRRWMVLAGTVVGCLILAGLFLALATPQYSAETLIMIEPKNSNIVSIEEVVSGLSGDEETIQSEVYVLTSRSLAGRVVLSQSLYDDPEFNPDGVAIDTVAAEEGMSREFGAVVDRFLDKLQVVPKENSRVIGASFTSESAEKAATVINALADQYILSRLESKFASTQRANDWLGVRIAELRANVQDLETQVEAARERFGLLGAEGIPLASREMIELNTQLVMTRSERAEAEARLTQIEDLSPGGDNNESLNEVLDSPLIQRLREQESEVKRREAELSTEYGNLHPRMIQLRAEADDIAARIDAEIARIVAGLKSQVEVVKAREESLEQSLDGMKKEVAVANQNEIELRALEREAEASRNLLATMLSRQKETISQEDGDFQQADVRVISPADIPLEPSYPSTTIVLGLVIVFAFILAMVIILILELLDDGFRNGEEMEKATGVPSIGFVPFVSIASDYDSLPEYIWPTSRMRLSANRSGR